MIVIALGAERSVDPEDDPLHRDRVGYSPTMSALALYDANHGTWVIGQRHHHERYALFVFRGIVKQAVKIDSINLARKREPDDTRDDRYVIDGEILAAGHPVYDTHVGKPSPLAPRRNPVGYFDSEFDIEDHDHRPADPAAAPQRLCRCGCGTLVGRKDFVPGHDQVALHERVREIGTVAEFIQWFDIVRGHRLPGQSERELAEESHVLE